MYIFYLDGLALPVTPSKVEFKRGNKNRTVDLIDTGEANILKGRGLTTVDFEAELPQQKYPYARYEDGFLAPEYYILKLKELKDKKRPFRFTISRTSPSSEKLFGSDMLDVSLEEWTVTEDAGNGMDVIVKISLKEYREYAAKILNPVNTSPSAGFQGKSGPLQVVRVMKQRKQDKQMPEPYTVKAGDKLWLICKKLLGAGEKYREIAKKNGIANPNVIKPGQVIRFD